MLENDKPNDNQSKKEASGVFEKLGPLKKGKVFTDFGSQVASSIHF